MAVTGIIGGGITGLSLGHLLKARGQEVVVLEGAERPGGAIHTFQESGFLAEAGPNGFLDREPAMGKLLASLDLATRVRVAEPSNKLRFVFLRGALRALPTSPPALLKSDLIPFGEKLRGASELFVGRPDLGEDESVASFARRRFGPGSVPLFDAMQTGIYAGDAEKLSLLACFPRLASLELEHRSVILGLFREQRRRSQRATFSSEEPPPGTGDLCSFDGGMGQLIASLAAALGSSLCTSARVERIAREGDRWTLHVANGSTQSCDHLVVALPAHAASPLVRPHSAPLAEELGRIEHCKIAVVHLGFRREALAKVPTGFGFLVPSSENRSLLGCIYASSVFPWRAPESQVLLTCLVGGAARPDLVDLSDDELMNLAREELKAIAGVAAEPTYRKVVKWPKAVPQYTVGHLTRVDRIFRLSNALPAFSLAGNSYRGVGINDCVRNASELCEALCRTPGDEPQRHEVKVATTR